MKRRAGKRKGEKEREREGERERERERKRERCSSGGVLGTGEKRNGLLELSL